MTYIVTEQAPGWPELKTAPPPMITEFVMLQSSKEAMEARPSSVGEAATRIAVSKSE